MQSIANNQVASELRVFCTLCPPCFTLWIDFHEKMHCEPSLAFASFKMAEKKQQWRETTSYASDSEEEDKHDAPVPRHLTKSIAKPQSSFNHPVYKKISRVNNFINSLTTKEIRCKLTELGLSDKYVLHALFFFFILFYIP